MNKIIANLSMKRKPKAKESPKTPDKSAKSTKKRRPRKTRAEKEFDMCIHPEQYAENWVTRYTWGEEGLKCADVFMKQYAELGPEGIKAEFHKEVGDFKSPTYADTAWHANATKNADKKTVTCLDDSRVVLVGKNDYINASWAYDTKKIERKFIVTQAPTDETLHDFWQMCYEQRAFGVFALCNSAKDNPETHSPNSIQLWPSKEDDDMPAGHVTLHNKNWSHVRSFRGQDLTITMTGLKPDKNVLHTFALHILAWEKPPYTQLTARKMLRILSDMALIEGEMHRPKDPIILMDDFSGIGNASILLVGDVVGSLLYKGEKNVTLPAIVKWARMCRNGAIRNEEDYLMVVRLIAERIHTMGDNKFKDAYEKICGIEKKEANEEKKEPEKK